MIEPHELKEIEEMTTTSSFILTIGQMRWIDLETERIKNSPNAPKRFNKSALVRSVIDRAIAESADVELLVGVA